MAGLFDWHCLKCGRDITDANPATDPAGGLFGCAFCCPRAPVMQARGSDPETSHAAMAAFDPDRMGDAAKFAERLHLTYGPMADFQYKKAWDRDYPHECSPHLYRQARSVARDSGRIRETTERRTNPESLRDQIVWEACDVVPPIIKRCPMCGHVLRREDE